MQREYECRGVYETSGGDRVALFNLGDHWFICWAYSDPFTSTPQLIAISSEAEAAAVFTGSREGCTLSFDSRTEWIRGSI